MTTQPKQHEVLAKAVSFLNKQNREPRVAHILLQHHLNVSRAAFYAMMRDPVPEHVLDAFINDIKKHAETGVPVQHLTGQATFYGRDFTVNEDVLIPRPETEEVVQQAITMTHECAEQNRPFTIVDVGTGSGVIAITLALELPETTVYATDISQAALTVAQKNAHQLQAHVTFLEVDFLQPIIDNDILPNLVIANPPYIPSTSVAALPDTVKHFDPACALFAGKDGLAAYRTIMAQSKDIPAPEAFIFEIGHDQGEAVQSLVRQTYPASDVTVHRDLHGKERIVTAILHKSTD